MLLAMSICFGQGIDETLLKGIIRAQNVRISLAELLASADILILSLFCSYEGKRGS